MSIDLSLKILNINPNEVNMEYLKQNPNFLEQSYLNKFKLWENPQTLDEYQEQIKLINAYQTLKSEIKEMKVDENKNNESTTIETHNLPIHINFMQYF